MLVINATTVDRVSPDYASFVVLLIGIVVGATVGCISGGILAAVNGRMGESFIITYAIQIIVAAVANAVVNGQFQSASYKSGMFKMLGSGVVPVLFFLIIAVIMQFILVKTAFGRNLYFLGANMEAAKMAGIRTRRIRFAAHAGSAPVSQAFWSLRASTPHRFSRASTMKWMQWPASQLAVHP